MYNIVGPDEKEYGPVTADLIRKWISNGRLGAQSRARREGSSEWVTLDTLPEFALAFASLPPAPPLPSTVVSPKTSGLAVTSLVLGILGVCGVTALAGLILGIVALVKIRNSEGRLSGRGLAIGGIAAAAAFLVLAGFVTPRLVRVVVEANRMNQLRACRSNLQQLVAGVMTYARDNGGKCPPADAWCDAVRTNVWVTNYFQCPVGDPAKPCHYAYNAKLDGMELAKIRDRTNTVVIFETAGGWNLSGDRELALKTPRHGRWVLVGFADGKVHQVSRARMVQLQWDP